MNIFSKLYNFLYFKMWARLRVNHFSSFKLSHSQFGEDMIIKSIFGNKRNGTFIDIGAHHPVYYSNTYHFYCCGWRGYNIDAIPNSMKIFKIIRREDINIEACIGNTEDSMTFFEFEKTAISTLIEDIALKQISNNEVLKKKHILKTFTIQSLVEKYKIPKNIDFLNLDIEGLDEEILLNFNFDLLSPKVIAFEDHKFNLNIKNQSKVISYLEKNKYKIVGLTGPTIIMSRI